jgi:hypothetical protein
MTKAQYVSMKTFNDVKENTTVLIDILNHNMTIMKNDISWLKKLQSWQIALSISILIAIIGVPFFIK